MLGSELSLAVCGAAEVDVDMLRRHTEYAGGATERSPHVRHFWATMRRMSQAQRRAFIRFAWGQERLPATDAGFDAGGVRLRIKSREEPPTAGGEARAEDGRLPRADTCFFNVELPAYSSEAVMRR